jgi:5-carboxymethyl-2-hydroxymuconate isomerase
MNNLFRFFPHVRKPLSRAIQTCSRRLQEYKIVERSEVEEFIQRCMTKVGTSNEHAQQLAKVLSTGDLRGHFSHGLNRLGKKHPRVRIS